MKNIALLLALQLFGTILLAQPGKYAGSMKKLINKTYTDDRKIPGLTGWKFQEGSMITNVDDPELMTAGVFKKGTTFLVLFSYKEDTSNTAFVIVDVLEVKNVLSTQTIRTGTCSDGPNETIDVAALIKKEMTESSKAIKAWRLNRDKKRIEVIPAKAVKCMNEVD